MKYTDLTGFTWGDTYGGTCEVSNTTPTGGHNGLSNGGGREHNGSSNDIKTGTSIPEKQAAEVGMLNTRKEVAGDLSEEINYYTNSISKLTYGSIENTISALNLVNDEYNMSAKANNFIENFECNLIKTRDSGLKVIAGAGQLVAGTLMVSSASYAPYAAPVSVSFGLGNMIHGVGNIEEGITTLGSVIGLSEPRNATKEVYGHLGLDKAYVYADIAISISALKAPLSTRPKMDVYQNVSMYGTVVKATPGSVSVYGSAAQFMTVNDAYQLYGNANEIESRFK
ncbi:hypothetical protein [Thaumasiovibrio sp. DFM-14]|uniref:hypothetical protein n=1 Tax=Thaumasiovibrio sp. DFM-14 TaxID=3384792 RepID=UPI0039A0E7E6